MTSLLHRNSTKDKVLLILLVVTLLPVFILSFYNHPTREDYDYTNMMFQKGFFGAQKEWYLNQGGRYFSDILVSLNPMVFGANLAYKLNAIILMLLLLISTYWLSGKLFKNMDISGKTGICSLFVFSYLIYMPNMGQGIFWQTGIYNSFMPDIMTFFLLGCIISYYRTTQKKLYFILSGILIFAIIGSYEIHMVFIDLLILIITLVSILKKQKLLFPLTLLSLCIIFSIIEITAPGNSMRSTWYLNPHQFLASAILSVSYGKIFIAHWMPFMLLIGLLLSNLLSKKSIWNEETFSNFILPPWLCFMACLTIPFIGMFIPLWSEGVAPVSHVINGIYFYFSAGMFYFSFSCIAYIKKNYPDFHLSFYKKIALILVLLLFSNDSTNNIIKNNITKAYKDIISGKAAAYNREQNERNEFLLNFKGDSCVIDSIKDIPSSLYFRELRRDRNSWENKSFCQYYHKKYIGIKRK